ncbi:MAG: tryptophan 7-halogenase [Myxococcota bacterium]
MRADLDVAILGGGLAGNLLARQLRRRLPGLRVGLFERSRDPAYKVGESTVEIAGHYLIRRQGLSRYLYEEHLPKNGIRYFFDSPERDTPLLEMSELGTVNLPFHPSFQIDRARMETDLLEMNRREGVDVRLGVEVTAVELCESGGPHVVELCSRSGRERLRARWLVDAAGREGLLARQLDWRVPESEHRIGSAWARFEGVADIDQLGDEAFRGRVRHTARGLSTLHFLHSGYWIWVIPLRGGLTSVGVVGSPVRDVRLRTPEGFRSFLDGHRAVRELMDNAKSVDFGSLGRIAYGARHFLDARRFALVGEAASAADPLYSPGIDFIALENDFLTDLVAREAEGEGQRQLTRRTRLYDRFVAFRHEATMGLYRGLYGMIGSYELMGLKWDFDIGSYHNLWVSPYMTDRLTDIDFLSNELRQQRFVQAAMKNFRALFSRVEAALRVEGSYHRRNRGAFRYGLENIDFLERIGLPRSQEETIEQATRTFNVVRRNALALLGEEAPDPWPLPAFVTRSLV